MAKVVFSFNGNEIIIQCTKEDKMKDICNKFATKIDININSLLFLYNGNKINYEQTFKQHANSIDNNNSQMNLLVYQIKNEGIKCKKCGETIDLDIIDNIIKYNNEQKETIIEMNNQIDNIINLNNINDIKRKVKVINLMLNDLRTENDKCLKNIQDTMSNNYISINNNLVKIEKKKKDNMEIIKKGGFDSNEEKIIKDFILKCNEQYSGQDFMEIAENIFYKLSEWKEGRWSIIVGEKNKYQLWSSYTKMMGINIGLYKVGIIYNS